jgi:hypothetical protein
MTALPDGYAASEGFPDVVVVATRKTLRRIRRFTNSEALQHAAWRYLCYYAAPTMGQVDRIQLTLEPEDAGRWPERGTFYGIVDLPPKVARITIRIRRWHREYVFWRTFYHELDHLLYRLEHPDMSTEMQLEYKDRPHEIRAKQRGAAWANRHRAVLPPLSGTPPHYRRIFW